MPSLSNTMLYEHAKRLVGRTIIITGAGSGFGRETALEFTKLGANVVLGDVDLKGMEATEKMVVEQSGEKCVVTARCDVTNWDDQLALFRLGKSTFGSIDIVLPNAGVNEMGRIDQRQEDVPQDSPQKPNMKTLDIDLVGVIYTVRIALWYFSHDERKDPGLRAIALTGSMSSFYGAWGGIMYGAAKAGILGIQKGIEAMCLELNVRCVTICPYFTKTAIIAKDFVHPTPQLGWAQIEDVTAAFVGSITDPKHNFGCWLIPDQWGVYRMETSGQFIGAEGARRLDKRRDMNGAAKL